MTDLVNAHFKKFYPKNLDPANMRYTGIGFEYGDRTAETIFPQMVCADGFKMSVQGHHGAYSYPRDDFADEYKEVEIMCVEEPLFEAVREGNPVGEEFIYPYIGIQTVLAVIEKHGGLIP